MPKIQKQHVVQLVGAVAFLIGGVLARANALEAFETLEDFSRKLSKSPSNQS